MPPWQVQLHPCRRRSPRFKPVAPLRQLDQRQGLLLSTQASRTAVSHGSSHPPSRCQRGLASCSSLPPASPSASTRPLPQPMPQTRTCARPKSSRYHGTLAASQEREHQSTAAMSSFRSNCKAQRLRYHRKPSFRFKVSNSVPFRLREGGVEVSRRVSPDRAKKREKASALPRARIQIRCCSKGSKGCKWPAPAMNCSWAAMSSNFSARMNNRPRCYGAATPHEGGLLS
jgi:hypothetical protein